MIHAALAIALLQAPAAPATQAAPGRAPTGREVRPPRIEAEVTIDGALDEATWGRAAVLSGFSQFSPQDGIAAADSTEVRVWYSPTAIHFGVRAYQPAGTVRATLADRDKIFSDDNIQFLIGTFNDRRQATVVMVNPLGVQADGTIIERGQLGGGGFASTGQAARESADLSPDLVFTSKGRVTEFGYEVEVRIPFKSLRYQSSDTQTWDFNVVRQVNYRGYEDSWAPARRGMASFLGQGGSLAGISGIHRGIVMDVTPEVTQRTEGLPAPVSALRPGQWDYAANRPVIGANVRWGITNNLSLGATINPDFSQVEADATPVQFDPRQAVSFPEKRPFFLEGSEQFSVPNNLVYSRRIIQPRIATKLAGKSGPTGLAVLSAVDATSGSASRRDNPVYNIVRLQRDLGTQSRIGLAYTDKVDGANYNRVFDVDGRYVWRRANAIQYQFAGSLNRASGFTSAGPLWDVRYNRSGRNFSGSTFFKGISDKFITQTGFISRTGQTQVNARGRYTMLGQRGARLEQLAFELMADGLWDYRNWLKGGDARDKKAHLNVQSTWRGGWTASTSLLLETFGYDPGFYGARYRILRGPGDTLAFTGTPRLPNRDYVFSVATPKLKYLTLSATTIYGQDENFAEWAGADIQYLNVSAELRPTEQLRIAPTFVLQDYRRRSDGSRVQRNQLPRVKVEYQVTRDLFVRVIGEYASNYLDALRDDGRTGKPLLVRSGGRWVQSTRTTSNNLRSDVLIQYRPMPGAVIYAGYSALMREPSAFAFDDVTRTSDAVFLKASWLFRN
ncbi:MAG: carbohydrate binding family 9 domain-containing protein [Gemmatimonadetes bacterium]|nr:carbohydrate binding family 9 domain-containing protein [Gemmatimonadota bacterium]